MTVHSGGIEVSQWMGGSGPRPGSGLNMFLQHGHGEG